MKFKHQFTLLTGWYVASPADVYLQRRIRGWIRGVSRHQCSQAPHSQVPFWSTKSSSERSIEVSDRVDHLSFADSISRYKDRFMPFYRLTLALPARLKFGQSMFDITQSSRLTF